MISTTEITIDNFNQYPVGTAVEFNFGAYYPTREGVVTGYKIISASKWFDASVCLVAEYNDLDTDEVVETTITRFVDKGIGTYLIEVAENTKQKGTSPWTEVSV